MMIDRRLWRLALARPGPLALTLALLLAVAATYLAQAFALASGLSGLVSGDHERTVRALLTVIGLAAARLALTVAQVRAAAALGQSVAVEVRDRALEAALDARRLHDGTARDGSTRLTLTDGVDGIDTYLTRYIGAVVQVVVVCPIIVVTIATVSVPAALAVGACAALAVLAPTAWKRVGRRRGHAHWDSYEGLSADLLESLRGMKTLRILGDIPGTRSRLVTRSDELHRATVASMRVSLADTALTDLAVQAGIAAAAAVAVTEAVSGAAPSTSVYVLLLLSSEAFRPIRDLARHWHAGFLGLSAVPALQALGALEPRSARPSSARVGAGPGARAGAVPAPIVDPHAPLLLTGVGFRYPGADRDVLAEVTARVERGRLTVIVGESGVGKSTLFDLVLGHLHPARGTIRLGESELSPDQVAVLSQRSILFAGTVRENLTAARPDATDAELFEACRRAGVLDEVLALPGGLDGLVSEAGSSLSGGQRQRVALARALLSSRPVLLVDEPTSALDGARADRVVEALRRCARDRIVVMVTHRVDALDDRDRVLELRDGHLLDATAGVAS